MLDMCRGCGDLVLRPSHVIVTLCADCTRRVALWNEPKVMKIPCRREVGSEGRLLLSRGIERIVCGLIAKKEV